MLLAYARTLLRCLGKLVLAGSLIGVPVSAADGGKSDLAADPWVDPDTAQLFEARIGRLRIGNGIRAFETDDGLCLDFGDFTGALQLAIEVEEGGRRASGWAFSEDNAIIIDRDAGRVQFGSAYEPIKPGSFWQSRSGWCVLADDLSRWVGVTLAPDLTNAVLGIESDNELPIEQAAQRAIAAERLRDMENGATPAPPIDTVAMPYRMWRLPSVDLSVQLGASRDLLRGARHKTTYELFAAGELAYFSTEARLVSDDAAIPRSLRVRFYREDAGATLLGPAGATFFGFGDVESRSSPIAAQSMPGRGIALDNRPLGLSANSDTAELVGDLPKGWDAELYLNGELIDATGGTNGRYEFRDIQLQFGTNRLEVVRYGPQGQVRRERRLYNIAAQSPGEGEFWYSFAALQDRRDLIDWRGGDRPGGGWRATGQVEYGLGKGASIGLGIYALTRDDAPGEIAEVTARAGLLGFLNEANIAADSAGGMALRLRSIGQVGGASLSLETILNRGLSSERLAPTLRSNVRLVVNPRLKRGGQILPLSFDLARIETTQETVERARIRASITKRSFAVGLSAGYQQSRRPLGDTLRQGTLDMLFNARLGGVRLRGEANWEIMPRARFSGAQADAVFAIGATGNGQASIGYGASDGRLRMGFGYTRSFAPVALTASASADDSGALSLGLNLTMSIGPNGRGRFGAIRAESRAATGALLIRAFDDRNGDGIRQPDEEFETLGSALVNGLPTELEAHADGEGAILGSLDPAVPVKVAIDPSTIADPTKVPTRPAVMVVPRAGVVMPLNIGIASTGSIEGTLVDLNGALAGHTLELVDETGGVAARTRTEFDGLFVFEGVRQGQYSLRVETASGALILRTVVVSAQDNWIRLGSLRADERSGKLAANSVAE